MLKKNPAERAFLSDILQDTELNTTLQNPLDGHTHTHTHTTAVCLLYVSFKGSMFPLSSGHWSDVLKDSEEDITIL